MDRKTILEEFSIDEKHYHKYYEKISKNVKKGKIKYHADLIKACMNEKHFTVVEREVALYQLGRMVARSNLSSMDLLMRLLEN